MRTGYSCYCYTNCYARICVAVSVAEIDLQGRNQGLAFDSYPRVADKRKRCRSTAPTAFSFIWIKAH